MSGKKHRLEAIRRILEARVGSTQEQIREQLASNGILASQATLSRDLREMGAVKLQNGRGISVYRLVGESRVDYSSGLAASTQEFVLEYENVGNFVVIKTTPSNASDFCLVLDRQEWPEIMGTIAGDDTILVITRSVGDAENIVSRLTSVAP